MTPFADVPKRVPILVLIPFLLDATQGLKSAELRIDAAAIERVVTSQFFTTAHQRHYVSGDENSKCD